MWMSAIPLTPPLAITGMSTARARSTVAWTLQPLSSPSRPTSVNSSAATPASSNRRAMSIDRRRRTRRPSRASRPCRRLRIDRDDDPAGEIARRRRARDRGSPAPRCRSPAARRRASNQPSIAARSRMPPPSWTWPGKRLDHRARPTSPLTDCAGERAVEVDHVEIAARPLRRTPSPARPGRRRRSSRESMSPSDRRTTLPPFRSIAGKTISSWPPLQEAREQVEAVALALFGVELHARQIVARDRRDDRAAMVGGRDHVVALERRSEWRK